MHWIAINFLPPASNYDEVVGLCGKVHIGTRVNNKPTFRRRVDGKKEFQ